MGHEVAVSRSVPVLDAVRCPVDVTSVQFDDVLAPGLDKAVSFDDHESLPSFMGVPGVKCTALTFSAETLLGSARLSIQTSPVNQSAGPRAVGFFGSMAPVVFSFSFGCRRGNSKACSEPSLPFEIPQLNCLPARPTTQVSSNAMQGDPAWDVPARR
jgi:hypothetical protein